MGARLKPSQLLGEDKAAFFTLPVHFDAAGFGIDDPVLDKNGAVRTTKEKTL
jgi:hypothetical protein